MTNLMQLRRLVRSRMGVPADDDFMADNVLDDHINLACQSLDAEAHWPWQETTEAVTITPAAPHITPTEEWRATRSVVYPGRELVLIAPADMIRMDLVVSDIPTVWCPIGGLIEIRPRPLGPVTLAHFFYMQCMWLYNDSDAPMIPAEYTGAIVAKAAELLAQRESSGGDASRHGSEYSGWVARMRRDMRRSTPGVHVRVRPGSWV